jgi:hypothetical protein
MRQNIQELKPDRRKSKKGKKIIRSDPSYELRFSREKEKEGSTFWREFELLLQ